MKEIKKLLKRLLTKKIIGGKHTPEQKIVNLFTKWLNKQERKEFEKMYKQLINEEIIIRTKKQTGKGTNWHVNLNSRKIQEIREMVR